MALGPLDVGLDQLPVPPISRLAIIESFWGSRISMPEYEQQAQDTDSYFRYYEEQCRARLHGGVNNTLTRTHADIARIVQLLKDGNHTRESIKDTMRQNLLQQHDNSELNLENAIDFALRLWMMVHVGNFVRGLIPGQTAISWESGTLHGLINAQFSPQCALQEPVKFEKIFIARNLERMAGIHIIWTDNLADHLRMKDDDTRVAIFHHVSLLEYHKNW